MQAEDRGGLPPFKYHPDPLKTGALEERSIRCQVCGRPSRYRYGFPLYAVEDVENVCPWCIADGSACRKYDGTLVDPHVVAGRATSEAREELARRTPAYGGAQEAWPDHCGDFCAFLRNVSWAALAPLEAELTEDLDALGRSMNLTRAELQLALGERGYLQGYLFRCLHCGRHRCHADAD